eukprot:1014283-Amphidinium_carterae.5
MRDFVAGDSMPKRPKCVVWNGSKLPVTPMLPSTAQSDMLRRRMCAHQVNKTASAMDVIAGGDAREQGRWKYLLMAMKDEGKEGGDDNPQVKSDAKEGRREGRAGGKGAGKAKRGKEKEKRRKCKRSRPPDSLRSWPGLDRTPPQSGGGERKTKCARYCMCMQPAASQDKQVSHGH